MGTDMMYAQYTDNVIGPGSPRYDNAYFAINYVRVYTVPSLASALSSSLYHASSSSTPRPSKAASGSNNWPNTGAVLTVSSSLRLFLLCLGALAVFI